MCFLWFLILIGVREVGEIHLSADLPVVFGDLDLAGSHIDTHHHLRVDCFGSCELCRDSDLVPTIWRVLFGVNLIFTVLWRLVVASVFGF